MTTTPPTPPTLSPDLRAAHAIYMMMAGITKLTWRTLDEHIQQRHPGLTGMHIGALRTLSRQAFTLSELAARLMVTPSTLVPVVDRLQELSLVSRQKDPHDRRRAPLAVSPAGLELLRGLPLAETHVRLIEGLRQLGPARAAELEGLLLELLSHVDPDGWLTRECSAAAGLPETARVSRNG